MPRGRNPFLRHRPAPRRYKRLSSTRFRLRRLNPPASSQVRTAICGSPRCTRPRSAGSLRPARSRSTPLPRRGLVPQASRRERTGISGLQRTMAVISPRFPPAGRSRSILFPRVGPMGSRSVRMEISGLSIVEAATLGKSRRAALSRCTNAKPTASVAWTIALRRGLATACWSHRPFTTTWVKFRRAGFFRSLGALASRCGGRRRFWWGPTVMSGLPPTAGESE